MTNYKKGARFEYRVRDLFRKFGYEAERKAASAPYDIIVIRDGKVCFIVDAKKTSQRKKDYIYLKRSDLDKLIKESEKIGAVPLVIYGFYRTPVFVEFPDNIKNKKTIRLEKGLELKKYLSNIN